MAGGVAPHSGAVSPASVSPPRPRTRYSTYSTHRHSAAPAICADAWTRSRRPNPTTRRACRMLMPMATNPATQCRSPSVQSTSPPRSPASIENECLPVGRATHFERATEDVARSKCVAPVDKQWTGVRKGPRRRTFAAWAGIVQQAPRTTALAGDARPCASERARTYGARELAGAVLRAPRQLAFWSAAHQEQLACDESDDRVGHSLFVARQPRGTPSGVGSVLRPRHAAGSQSLERGSGTSRRLLSEAFAFTGPPHQRAVSGIELVETQPELDEDVGCVGHRRVPSAGKTPVSPGCTG